MSDVGSQKMSELCQNTPSHWHIILNSPRAIISIKNKINKNKKAHWKWAN